MSKQNSFSQFVTLSSLMHPEILHLPWSMEGCQSVKDGLSEELLSCLSEK
jgi:hypothetical protein